MKSRKNPTIYHDTFWTKNGKSHSAQFKMMTRGEFLAALDSGSFFMAGTLPTVTVNNYVRNLGGA
jgi:hypothetical protein